MASETEADETNWWLPYEHEEDKFKCRLACYNPKSKERFMTADNLIDGTPCSYDHPSNICVQVCIYIMVL